MNKSGRIKLIGSLLGLGVAVASLVVLLRTTSLGEANTWQRQASPGRLSASHAFLENNCAACHTSVRGVEAANCTVCHANNESLLQRQPTAFHGDVGSCRECHPEHQGGKRPPTTMDHDALAKIGLRQPGNKDGPDSERALFRKQLVAWINRQENAGGTVTSHPHVTPLEAVLNCAACHATNDRHFGYFGPDCAQCHATTRWTIPEFRHPSPRSTDCAQCHQATPCHYMPGHFNKICTVVAGQPQARVDQCYLCHQTTAWNDIKGFGWCKCH
jgi:hypothetical protein